MEPADEIQQLLACPDRAERLRRLAQYFEDQRGRLRKMVELRLDARLQGRLDPSDVLQEAFVELSQRLDEFLERRPMPLFVWVRFLTGQRLAALHRFHLGVKARDPRREVKLEPDGPPAATSASLSARLVGVSQDPGSALAREDERARVQAALDDMSPLEREIIALRHFEELSNAEAAQVLRITENAAAGRYFRALNRLREVLKRSSGSEGGKAEA
jgi:RNA polymerase sigma-70 factor (ECF subfamily)